MSTQTNPKDYLSQTYRESVETRDAFLKEHSEDLIKGAEMMGKCVKSGGKVMICGNGGSAADAQHMAAEMVGRMLIERRPLAALALTTDTSNITAIANDFSYEDIFSMQVQGLGRAGDILIAITTSGNSKNVIRAVEAAKKMGIHVIGLTGGKGGKLREIGCDLFLCASNGKNSSRIQEAHSFAVHSLVDLMDRFYL